MFRANDLTRMTFDLHKRGTNEQMIFLRVRGCACLPVDGKEQSHGGIIIEAAGFSADGFSVVGDAFKFAAENNEGIFEACCFNFWVDDLVADGDAIGIDGDPSVEERDERFFDHCKFVGVCSPRPNFGCDFGAKVFACEWIHDGVWECNLAGGSEQRCSIDGAVVALDDERNRNRVWQLHGCTHQKECSINNCSTHERDVANARVQRTVSGFCNKIAHNLLNLYNLRKMNSGSVSVCTYLSTAFFRGAYFAALRGHACGADNVDVRFGADNGSQPHVA